MSKKSCFFDPFKKFNVFKYFFLEKKNKTISGERKKQCFYCLQGNKTFFRKRCRLLNHFRGGDKSICKKTSQKNCFFYCLRGNKCFRKKSVI